MGVAVLGCGAWGMNHVRVWERLGQLVAFVDPDGSGRARAAVAAPKARALAHPHDAFGLSEVTAVVIATPAATHAELAHAALKAGRHVLVEKPLALSVPEAEKLVLHAEEADRVLMVGHVLEYHPGTRALRDLVASGQLGRIRYLYSHRLNFGRLRTEENALWSFAPHDVALMLRLTGAPDHVACWGQSFLNHDVEDVTVMNLGFPNGVAGHVFVSWLHPFKEQRFVVVGELAMAVFDDTAPWSEKLRLYPHRVDWVAGRVPVARHAEAVAMPLTEEEPLELECRDFLDAIDGRPPLADGASGLRVLKVLDAAQRSLAIGGSRVSPASPTGMFLADPTAVIEDGASIGYGTRIWHFCHIMAGATIGAGCTLGQNVFVASGAHIGNHVRIQNNVSIYEGVELADEVFCGPSVVFSNVKHRRAFVDRKGEFTSTRVGAGATIGANATIVCGTRIGEHAFVGAGAVVTADVAPFALVVGVPARRVGWVCKCGETLAGDGKRHSCRRCRSTYEVYGGSLSPVSARPGSGRW